MPEPQPHKPAPRKDVAEDVAEKDERAAAEAKAAEDEKAAEDAEAAAKALEPTVPEASVAGVGPEFVDRAVDRAREGSHTFKD